MIDFVMLAILLALLWTLQQMFNYMSWVSDVYKRAKIPAIEKKLDSNDFYTLRGRTFLHILKVAFAIIPLNLLAIVGVVFMWFAMSTDAVPLTTANLGEFAIALSGTLVILATTGRPGWLSVFNQVVTRTATQLEYNWTVARLLQIQEVVKMLEEPKDDAQRAYLQELLLEAEFLTETAQTLQKQLF